MVMAILVAHKGGTILVGELRHVGRDIADGKADPPVVRRVGRRAVNEAHVVQRHLAGMQGDDPPPRTVDLDHHLLAARQQIVFGEGVAMGDLIELVAARDVLDRPVRLGPWCEGDPRRHDIGFAEPPIGRVLVPRHEGLIGRLLDEEVAGPAQEIPGVEILDGVEDRKSRRLGGTLRRLAKTLE